MDITSLFPAIGWDFFSPQLGDVTGDGRAELAVIHRVDSTYQTQFYELHGQIQDTSFALREDLSAGLPTDFRKIRLGDLNDDGRAEVIGWHNGHWSAYTFGSGVWTFQDQMLPPIASDSLSILDVDDDGHADLCTTAGIWLNRGALAAKDRMTGLPSSFTLSAFPNPFNSEVEIRYDLPKSGKVELSVYNLLGQKVETLRTGMVTAGAHTQLWSPTVAGGIYFVNLRTANSVRTEKVLYLR